LEPFKISKIKILLVLLPIKIRLASLRKLNQRIKPILEPINKLMINLIMLLLLFKTSKRPTAMQSLLTKITSLNNLVKLEMLKPNKVSYPKKLATMMIAFLNTRNLFPRLRTIKHPSYNMTTLKKRRKMQLLRRVWITWMEFN